jgi:hypothetical protein
VKTVSRSNITAPENLTVEAVRPEEVTFTIAEKKNSP